MPARDANAASTSNRTRYESLPTWLCWCLTARSHSRRVLFVRRGRQMIASTMLARKIRRKTAPPGPMRLNRVAAIAEPNWTEEMPASTSAGEGARERKPLVASAG